MPGTTSCQKVVKVLVARQDQDKAWKEGGPRGVGGGDEPSSSQIAKDKLVL